MCTPMAPTPSYGAGDGAGSTLNGSIPAGSTNQSHTVYGKVPGGQNTLKAGSYSDSMVMTITYVP